MATYILRQLFNSVFIILGVITVTFVLVRVIPAGDPARLVAGQRTDLQTIESIRRNWKLDQPIYVQYGDFLLKAVQGDFGRSFASNIDVRETLLQKFPATAILAIGALALSSLLGVAIGVFSAWKPNSGFDYLVMVIALFGISVPVFVLGNLMQVAFGPSIGLGWIKQTQGYFISDTGRVNLTLLILPLLALAARPLSVIARITRSSMLDVMSQDYVRTARAKGVSTSTTVLKHALRNALNPVITTVSTWLAGTLAGTFFIETIFNWPGIGRLAFDAVTQLDFPMIQGTVLFTAVIFVVVNLIVDVAYAVLDPKVRLA
ncbi:MAG: ABC transporter permease [Bacteroidetes bacterium]|nr:ABC transporter permease [Bacteroidota bacterium]